MESRLSLFTVCRHESQVVSSDSSGHWWPITYSRLYLAEVATASLEIVKTDTV